MAAEMVWETPPPSRAPGRDGGVNRSEFVAALRARPGEWARYPTTFRTPQNGANAAGSARIKFPGTEWVSRKIDSDCIVFGRWVGPDSEKDA